MRMYLHKISQPQHCSRGQNTGAFYVCSQCFGTPSPSPPTSELWYLSGGKTEDYQNCSVLYCVLKLCAVMSILRWAVLTVLWIGFCHTGPISLCIDSFVFICVYFVYFCFTLHSCIIASVMEWTWWDWSVILRTYRPTVLWHCRLGHLSRKTRPRYDL